MLGRGDPSVPRSQGEYMLPITKLDFLPEEEVIPLEAESEACVEPNEVYLRQGDRLVLYADNLRQSQATLRRLKGLAEFSPRKFYVRRPAPPRKLTPSEILDNCADKLATVLSDPAVSRQEKLLSVYSVTNDAVSQVFTDFPNPRTLGSAISYLQVSTHFLTSDLSLISELQALMASDYNAYAHASSVYVYSVALAHCMGIRDEDSLRDVGLGALLHDIGKTKIDSRIEKKSDPLTEQEQMLWERHPALGESMVAHLDAVSSTVLRVIREHHERCDGSGYPFGLPKSRIHPMTHLIIVADTFDGLTKKRPDHEAYSMFEALSIMRKQCGALPADAFKVFVCMLAGIKWS
jgi:HD-GYP domain-containing protein (c-di-GMP phosphodiesterase class II)